jgi:hypothetical protein
MVLGFSRAQQDCTGLEVNLAPLQREHLAPEALTFSLLLELYA